MVLSKDIKFAICFGLILGALLSFCNLCFADDVQNVDYTTINNLYCSSANDHFTSTSASGHVSYFLLEKGYNYNINRDSGGNFIVVLSEQIPAVNVNYDLIASSVSSYQFSYTGDDDNYLCIGIWTTGDLDLNVTRQKISTLSEFAEQLALVLSFDNLGEIIVIVVPILAISVLFALGFYFIKRILNKAKKTKGGV